MPSSHMERLSRSAYFFLGTLLGFLIFSQWFKQEASGEIEKIAVNAASYVDDDFKKSLEKIVRDEIQQQIAIALASAPKADAIKNVEIVNQHQKSSDDQLASQDQKLHEVAYNQANHMLDEALAAGGFDKDSAKKYVSYLRSLPVEQEVAIRAKYANALNMGIIAATESPDALAAQSLD